MSTVHDTCLDLARQSTSRVERWALLALAARSESAAADREAREKRAVMAAHDRDETNCQARQARHDLAQLVMGLLSIHQTNRATAAKPVSTAPAN